jgi:diaminopimelate decarboxylase
MNNPLLTELLKRFTVVDDCLHMGDIPLTQLAKRVGQTPFYVYDRTLIKARIALLRHALPPALQLHYAIKANPMPVLVNYMASIVDGLDVASLGELRLALDTGMPAIHMSFTGPGKQPRELAAAIAADVIINIESEGELASVAGIGHTQGQRPKVALRVNPDFELKASGMKMAGGPKPFGIDAERVPTVLKQIAHLDVDFMGLQIFAGSQNLRAEALMEAHRKIVDLGLRLAESAPQPMQVFNMGGGFGIPYFPGDKALDLRPIGDNLAVCLAHLTTAQPDAIPVLELGRYLVGEAGIYVAQVVDRKVSRDHTFLITNGGMHHHLAASGNLGQVVRRNYPVFIGNRVQGNEREIASIVGPLCTPLDILADRLDLAKADVGDLVVVLQSGAYGLSASPVGFLSHPQPAEVFV